MIGVVTKATDADVVSSIVLNVPWPIRICRGSLFDHVFVPSPRRFPKGPLCKTRNLLDDATYLSMTLKIIINFG